MNGGGKNHGFAHSIRRSIAGGNRSPKKYREAAAQAADPETRLLFEQLVREEEQHEKRIRERIKAVKLLGY
ncbi:rubrerythrin [Carboxydocella sp. JDF658]|nr:rubrerythrin [Carboxydocella sp. JDF658]